VNAVRDMIATGVMPIGMSLAGLLVARAGIVIAFLVMGIGMFASCALALFDRKFRNVEMPEEKPERLAPMAVREEAYVI